VFFFLLRSKGRTVGARLMTPRVERQALWPMTSSPVRFGSRFGSVRKKKTRGRAFFALFFVLHLLLGIVHIIVSVVFLPLGKIKRGKISLQL